MKGHNKINLNLASMIEAAQEYFDKRYTPKIKVKNVIGEVVNGHSYSFEIEVEGEEVKE